MAVEPNDENPGAADPSGAVQPTMLTDADLDPSPAKRRKVCFIVVSSLMQNRRSPIPTLSVSL